MKNVELRMLEGSHLDAVVFVLDYLQLQLEGCTISFSGYPDAIVDGQSFGSGEPGYRDTICGFIRARVTSVEYEDEQTFSLSFKNGKIEMSLRPEDYTSPERIVINAPDRTIVL